MRKLSNNSDAFSKIVPCHELWSWLTKLANHALLINMHHTFIIRLPHVPPTFETPLQWTPLTEIQSSSLNFSLIIIIPYPIWPPYLCKGAKLKRNLGIAVHSFILSPRNRYAPPLTCFTELTPRKLRQRLKWKNFDGGLGERTTLMISQQSYPRCDGWEIYAEAVAHVDTRRACARVSRAAALLAPAEDSVRQIFHSGVQLDFLWIRYFFEKDQTKSL